MFLDKTKSELTDIFEKSLLDTNRGFNFYIDWSNIGCADNYIVEFHALDCLIGSGEDFNNRFMVLIDKVPSVVKTFPYLFALSKAERNSIISGNTKLKIIGTEIDSEDSQEYSFSYKPIDGKFNKKQKEKYLSFFIQMGLKNLYQNIITKSTYDYVVGVLVGLDSNGRKNRGGKAFELACEPTIRKICEKNSITVFTQKQFKMLNDLGLQINEDIANRKADFILFKEDKCMNIEVNFFTGSGSKPEEIIDSYINRQYDLDKNNIAFALITDGNCWQGTTNQLNKGFRHLSYLMNYKMCKNGMLEEIIEKVFNNG